MIIFGSQTIYNMKLFPFLALMVLSLFAQAQDDYSKQIYRGKHKELYVVASKNAYILYFYAGINSESDSTVVSKFLSVNFCMRNTRAREFGEACKLSMEDIHELSRIIYTMKQKSDLGLGENEFLYASKNCIDLQMTTYKKRKKNLSMLSFSYEYAGRQRTVYFRDQEIMILIQCLNKMEDFLRKN